MSLRNSIAAVIVIYMMYYCVTMYTKVSNIRQMSQTMIDDSDIEEFPDERIFSRLSSKHIAIDDRRKVLVRRPRLHELDPIPINLGKSNTPEALGLEVIPAHRPPGCILLGFSKCGTSAILEFLDMHPQVAVLDWESAYFCERMYPKFGLRWYVKKMPPSFPGQVTIEKSPCYIIEHDSHLRMHAMNSSLKVMVIVRDPITRILSLYGHYSAKARYWEVKPKTFEEKIYDNKTKQFRLQQLLFEGNYYPHVEHLLGVFPRNQVLILDGDMMVENPISQLRRIEDFLGLEHKIKESDIYFDQAKGFYCMNKPSTGQQKCLSGSKGRQHEELSPELREKLISLLKPYNEQFFKLIGQRFDWN